MKQKTGFVLRNICGENIIVAEGKENMNFSNIISMNESSALLWQKLENKEFTIEDMANVLMEEYEVSKETALADSKLLAQQWKNAGIIE
ncbi:MAG: PqqD family protein [Prevotella sp.]|nr:PqqD family protein [Prevotella sp.]